MAEEKIKKLEDQIDDLKMNQEMVMDKLGIKEVAKGEIKFVKIIKK